MPLTLNTPIMGSRPDFDPEQILLMMPGDSDEDHESLEAIKKWAEVAGIDPAVPSAQALVETANLTSVRYRRDKNLSGMGIVSDGTAQPFYIPDVDASARLFIQCLYSLVTRGRHPNIPLWPEGEEWFARVWLPKVKSAAMPKVSVLGDLGLRYTEAGDSRATWSWEDGKVPQDTYGKKLISRLNQFYPNLPDRSSAPQEPDDEEPQFATWRQQIDIMFGPGRNVTQGYGVDSGAADYSYGAGHGLNGHQHTGLDVGMPYGTKMYAPAEATVVCAGTGVGDGVQGLSCDAFNDWGDGNGSGSKKGIGRIELLFPDGRSLIYGHSRTSAVKPGDKVKRGQFLGTSGGMNGAHIHLEAREFRNGTYWLIDPKDLLETLPITSEEPMAGSPFDIVRNIWVDAPVTKQRDGQGYNVGTRQVIGIIQHETQGRGAGEWYRQFFSCPSGERCEDALVDYLIDREGKIYQFQDPFTSNRIPWASGGTPNRNSAIGKAVNDKYGNVNKYYAAVEIVKTDAERMTSSQIEATGRLTAYIMARCGYPANDWKYPDSLGGSIATSANHSDVSITTCRIDDADRAAFENRCTVLLEAFQKDGGTTTPPPPPEPEIVPGVDWGIAKRAFDNPTIPGYVLTKGGPLSNAYLERAKQTGQFPRLVDRWAYADGRVYYPFSNGDIALFTESDKKIRWIGPAT
jgi:murein DD-endopeptidase MepM/ murein hydrolase activator NlpD